MFQEKVWILDWPRSLRFHAPPPIIPWGAAMSAAKEDPILSWSYCPAAAVTGHGWRTFPPSRSPGPTAAFCLRDGWPRPGKDVCFLVFTRTKLNTDKSEINCLFSRTIYIQPVLLTQQVHS